MTFTPTIEDCRREIDSWIGGDAGRKQAVEAWERDAGLGQLQIVAVIWSLSSFNVSP